MNLYLENGAPELSYYSMFLVAYLAHVSWHDNIIIFRILLSVSK